MFWSRVRWTWQFLALASWLVIGLLAVGWNSPKQDLRCSFLAVGRGSCVVLELPDGETILYDAGSLGSPERASHTIASFLWSRRITQLDAIVLSHADVDHYNALPGLLEARYEFVKRQLELRDLGLILVNVLANFPRALDSLIEEGIDLLILM